MRTGRRTQQRTVIRRVLERAKRPLNPREVLSRAQKELPGLGIATVYRALKALSEDGWATPVKMPGESTRYERADHQHHHHFQCEDCNRVFDVPGCPPRMEEVKLPGFSVTSHRVTWYGRCPDCR